MSYLFSSARLGFRIWRSADLQAFARLNAHPEVMQHFPKPLSMAQSKQFLERLASHYQKHGFQYFAVELLSCQTLIGFLGLAYQKYPSPFTPAVDLGWRLMPEIWNKGYATEGAERCVKWVFETHTLTQLISTCPAINRASERVMQKIGMHKLGYFNHPNLTAYPHLKPCVCYGLERNQDI